MAIVSIPLLGQASGKFSDAEFLRLNGQNVLRSKKLKRYHSPSTEEEYRRLLLKKFVIGVKPLNSLFKYSMRKKVKFMNQFNRFVHLNYNLFSLNESGVMQCSDVSAIRFSEGSLSNNFSVSSVLAQSSNIMMELNYNDYPDLTQYRFFFIFHYYLYTASLFIEGVLDVFEPNLIVATYGMPPFNGGDYYLHICAALPDLSAFSPSCYVYKFEH